MKQFSSWRLTIVLLLTLLALSCKHPAAPAPPPPVSASTPTPPPPAPVVTLRAEPATLNRGGSTTLTWDARNAASVRIEPGLGDVGVTGNRAVTPASSVTYTATATGPGGTATDTVRITVNVPPPPAAGNAAPAVPSTPNLTVEQLFAQNVQPIYFDYDQSEIRADQISRLQANAGWLKQNTNVTTVMIEGNADERGGEEYNLALSLRRATSVKEYLVQQGVAESRLRTISYGEEKPECREQTEECYQKNRKAAFTLLP